MPWTFEGQQNLPESTQDNGGGWTFEGVQNLPDQEGALKTAGRYAAQVVKALPMAIPGVAPLEFTMGIAAKGAKQESLNDLEDMFDRGLLKNDEYKKAVEAVESQEVEKYSPTLGALYGGIERATGLPLEAKTSGQKVLSLASNVAAGAPGGATTKAIGAATAVSGSQALQQMGLDEDSANLLSSIAGTYGAGKVQQGLDIIKKLPINKTPPTTSQRQITQAKRPPPPPPTAMNPPPPPPVEAIGLPQEQPSYDIGTKLAEQLNLRPTEFATPEVVQPEINKPSATATKTAELKPQELPEHVDSSKLLAARTGGKDVGFRPADIARLPAEEKVGRTITPESFKNESTGGFAYKATIAEASRKFKKGESALYNLAEKAGEQATAPREELSSISRDIVRRYKDVDPVRLTPQENRLYAFAKDLADRSGDETGYKPISNAELMRDIRKINSLQDFDVEHGDPWKILNELKTPMREAILATEKMFPESVELYKRANSRHKEWIDIFKNDHIKDYLNLSNYDFKNLYNKPLTIDAFPQWQRAMRTGNVKDAEMYTQIAKKELVQKHLKEYIDKPKLIASPKFKKDLAELDFVLTPDEKTAVKNQLVQNAREHMGKKATKGEYIKVKIPEVVEMPKKFHGMTAEQLDKHANTVSGLKEIRHELSKTPDGAKIYTEFATNKAVQSLFNGKEGEYTGIEKALSDVNSKRYLEEAIGKQQVQKLESLVKDFKVYEDLISKKGKLRPPPAPKEARTVGQMAFDVKNLRLLLEGRSGAVKYAHKIGSEMVENKLNELLSNPENIDKLQKALRIEIKDINSRK